MNNKKNVTFFVFIVIFMVCLSFFRKLNNFEFISFYSILNYLSTCPSISIPRLGSFVISDSWGWFDFFRIFLNNTFLPFFEVIGIAGSCLLNALIFIGWFLGLFLGSSFVFGV